MADPTKDHPTYTVDYIKGDWDKAVYLDSPHTDNLMACVLGMGAEMWAMRRRMMITEKLLSATKALDLAKIETYKPDPAEQIAWEKDRDAYIERLFSVLTRETAKLGSVSPSDKVPPMDKL